MDFIPLAKAPCLLLVTGYHHLTYTSPNPPASAKSRQFVPSMADRVLKGMITIHTLDYVKVRIKTQWVHGGFMLFILRPVSGVQR